MLCLCIRRRLDRLSAELSTPPIDDGDCMGDENLHPLNNGAAGNDDREEEDIDII